VRPEGFELCNKRSNRVGSELKLRAQKSVPIKDKNKSEGLSFKTLNLEEGKDGKKYFRETQSKMRVVCCIKKKKKSQPGEKGAPTQKEKSAESLGKEGGTHWGVCLYKGKNGVGRGGETGGARTIKKGGGGEGGVAT